jgi:hypothetical protein
VGVGGTLTAAAKHGDFTAITKVARHFVEAIREARGR